MAKKKKGEIILLNKHIENPDFIVYTDGGCAVNPGGPGGIGVVILNQRDGSRKELSRGYESSTNNRMEIFAVITALEELKGPCSIRLFSDSQYTLNCMLGNWSKRKNDDLWRRLEKAASGKKMELNWVRGHCNNPENEKCDILATRGIQSPLKAVDDGYLQIKEEGREYYTRVEEHIATHEKTGAMAVNVIIPDALLTDAPSPLIPQEYARKYDVHYPCAKAICEFYAHGYKGFKAYMEVKTGGMDRHSRRRAEEISETTADPKLFTETLRKYFPDPRDMMSAARWYERGLTLHDAIRKVLVDIEVRENCNSRERKGE